MFPPLGEWQTWIELIGLMGLCLMGWYLMVRAGWELLRRLIARLRGKR